MKLFKSKVNEATASTAEDHENNDGALANEIARLEEVVENDPAAKAAAELAEFRMTPGAKSLLDRAMDNIAQNDGNGLEDPDAKQAAQMRAALVDAAGNDLSVVITALVDSCENPRDIAGTIYSLAYNVMKAAGFIANLDRQRYLDPRGDFDLTPYAVGDGKFQSYVDEALGHEFEADARQELRDAPLGLEDMLERERAFFSKHYGEFDADSVQRIWAAIYGRDAQSEDDIFALALEDLRLFLQLTVESFGWEPDRPIPFAFVMDPDGTFTPINDAFLALDHYEIKRQESRARRREKEITRLTAAAERAKALVKAAIKR